MSECKFKVGDYIRHIEDNEVAIITDIDNKNYYFISTLDNKHSPTEYSFEIITMDKVCVKLTKLERFLYE